MSSDSSEMDHDTDNAPPPLERRRHRKTATSRQQSSSADISKRIQAEPATSSGVSKSAYRPLGSAVKENKPIPQNTEFWSRVATNLTQLLDNPLSPNSSASNFSYLFERPLSPISSATVAKDPASIPKGSADKTSSIAKPAPFKEFTISVSDLPFTKEELEECLSLEEACGFLPLLIKTKRDHLRGMENDIDIISVELQKALYDAKNICIKLESAPKHVPQFINAARVQAQKLMYLLSTSSRIFERLYKSGKALKNHIDEYSKQMNDFHSSIDEMLEYIVVSILKKCDDVEHTF